MTNKEYADSLRLIADFYEKHEDMPKSAGDTIYVFVETKERFLAGLAAMKDGGTVKKDFSEEGEYARGILRRDFDGLALQLQIDRKNICKRIVTWDCPPSLLAELGEEAVQSAAKLLETEADLELGVELGGVA